jgi:predicted TPR repeat methyltransferase
MTDVEQSPETYNEMYREGGYAGIFNLPYKASPYYPLFKYVLKELRRSNVQSVLEVGCGAGAFAHLLHEKTDIKYRGFDFSDVAVEQAAK